MKKYMTTALMAVALVITACSSEHQEPEADAAGTVANITFAITGDFTLNTAPMTRSLTADGKAMTDVWVLDYVGGVLQQQLHQTAEDADFGTPTMELGMGTHHLYFVASRGQSPVLDTEAKTLTFTKVLDTFWTDYELTVSSGTASGSRAVALDRIVTRLKVTFSDAIPTGAATFNVAPAVWHYAFNYQTGEPSDAVASQATTIDIPANKIGTTGTAITVFGFSSATEWTTDIALDCKTSENAVLGQAVIEDAPFVRNRSSEYTGPLFTAGSGMTLSLNATRDDAYTGSW